MNACCSKHVFSAVYIPSVKNDASSDALPLQVLQLRSTKVSLRESHKRPDLRVGWVLKQDSQEPGAKLVVWGGESTSWLKDKKTQITFHTVTNNNKKTITQPNTAQQK